MRSIHSLDSCKIAVLFLLFDGSPDCVSHVFVVHQSQSHLVRSLYVFPNSVLQSTNATTLLLAHLLFLLALRRNFAVLAQQWALVSWSALLSLHKTEANYVVLVLLKHLLGNR